MHIEEDKVYTIRVNEKELGIILSALDNNLAKMAEREAQLIAKYFRETIGIWD